MITKSKKSLSVGLLGFALVIAGCGPGNGKSATASLSANLGSSTGATDSGSQNGSGSVDVFKAVDTELYVNVVGTGKRKVIWVDKVNKTIVYSMPLPGNPFGVGGRYPNPDHPDIYAELAQDPSSGSWSLNVVVPLRYLVRGADLADPHGLPNGGALPAIPGGELPRLGLRFFRSSGQEIYVYLSATIAAVFIPTPGFDPRIQLTFPLKNKGGTKILGFLSSVPARGSYDGGLFASFLMPPELSRIIDDMF